ncbi:MAG: sodium-translocating pyrophosphatase [Phycisphaerales bacterium]
MSTAWPYIFGPLGAISALVMAYVFSKGVMANSEGDESMIEIAEAVRQGAMAYLKRQYRVVFGVFIILIVVLALMAAIGVQEWTTVLGVPIAGLFSGLCGWFGMKMATNASARTAFAAKQSLNDGLRVAFRAGAVMGLVVVGFALLDVSLWFAVWQIIAPERSLDAITAVMLSYGMGASTQALFARVGGGIYTKAADVGADLVGKVEAGIPEDDARNPATIADNVGDNVGDVAGMGADLYESYYGSILASMALGTAAALGMGLAAEASRDLMIRLAVAPIALAGLGIFCSLVGVFMVKAKDNASFSQLLKGLHMGVWIASGLIAAVALVLLMVLFKDTDAISWFGIWGAIATGLIAGLAIASFTEYYTSYEHKPVKDIAEQAETGAATVIISGIAVGMISTWAPILIVVISIIAAFSFAGGADNFLIGLYGVGIAAVGMLSTLGITLATDAYGPIADNAGGNAEMTDQPPIVRERTDMLDSLGNTTAATGKGFAIGSAALTAMALLAAYVSVVLNSLETQLGAKVGDPAAMVESIGDGGEGTGYAVYQGHGEFGLVLRNPNFDAAVEGSEQWLTTGGLILANDRIRGRVDAIMAESDNAAFPFPDELDGDVNAYDIVVGSGENAVHFDMVPADRATIQQVLAFYNVTLMNPKVLGGIFLGVLLAFVFCAMTMNAVGRAAYEMMGECRRQFVKMKEGFKADGVSAEDLADPLKWPKKTTVDGVQYPDYAECVAISTKGAQREMVIPSILAIVVPILVGIILGVGGVMGLLVGGLTSGFAVAIYMANAGGAWDNAKKYIEKGHHGGKGSDAHKAGVVGDTVGDPFKDTSGPALNILIKLIAIVSVVFAGLVVKLSPIVGDLIGLG